jgi:hypothetical protein
MNDDRRLSSPALVAMAPKRRANSPRASRVVAMSAGSMARPKDRERLD